MTRKVLILQTIQANPGISSKGIWEKLWGADANLSHGVGPDDPLPYLHSLSKSGLIRLEPAEPRKGITKKCFPV